MPISVAILGSRWLKDKINRIECTDLRRDAPYKETEILKVDTASYSPFGRCYISIIVQKEKYIQISIGNC